MKYVHRYVYLHVRDFSLSVRERNEQERREKRSFDTAEKTVAEYRCGYERTRWRSEKNREGDVIRFKSVVTSKRRYQFQNQRGEK